VLVICLNRLRSRRTTAFTRMYRKPLTMHEISSCSGRRVACDSASGEASMRDETVFRVTKSRCHANPLSDRVFFRRRCNDSTFPWRAAAHYWGEGGNESRQQARVSKVRTGPILTSLPFSPHAVLLMLCRDCHSSGRIGDVLVML